MMLETFEQVTRTLPDCILVIDTEGTILSGNKAAFKTLQTDSKSLYGKNLKDLAPDQEDKVQRYLNNWSRSTEPLPGVLKLLGSDGCPVECHMRGNLLQAKTPEAPALILLRSQDKQAFTGAFTSLNAKIKLLEQEIAERKQAQQARRLSEERVRLLLDSTGEAIYGVDMDGNCTFVNPACVVALGYDSETALLGHNMHDLIHHTCADGTLFDVQDCRIYKNFEAGDSVRFENEVFWRKNGSCFPVEYSSHPIRRASEILGSVVTFRDVTKQRQAEETLRISEERLRSYFDAGMVGMVIGVPGSGFVQFNDKFCEILGYTREEMSLRTWVDMTHPDDLEQTLGIYNGLLSGEIEGWSGEKRYLHKDGRVVHASIFNKAIRGDDGAVVYTVALILDITESKQAQQQIRRSAEQLRRYFNSGMLGISIATPDKKWTDINDKYCEIVGYSREEMMNISWSEITHPDDMEISARYFNELLNGARDSYVLDKRCLRKDGQIVYITVSNEVVRNADGSVDYIITFVQDITERKISEQKMRQLSSAIEQIGDAVMITDQSGEVEYVNQAFTIITGYSREDVIGMMPNVLKSGKHSDEFYRDMWLILARGRTFSDVFTNRRKDGNIFYEAKTITPLKDSSGNITHYVSSGKDITGSKLAEENLRLYEHIVNASKDFIAIVDRQYRYIAVNKHYLDVFGRSREDAIGHHMIEIIGEEYFEKICKPNIDRVLTGESFESQAWGELPGLGYVCLNYKYNPYNDGSGNMLGVIITAYDVTSLREAQSKQEESENNLREAQRIAHLGSWELDLATNKLYWSEEIFNLFEIDPERFSASYEAFLEAVHPDDRETLNQVFQESVDKKIPYDYTHRLIMRDGRIKYVNERGRTDYDENGMPIRSVGTVLDITERILAQEKIQKLNEGLEQRVRQRTQELHNVNLTLEASINVLKNTQAQLVQSEKMASLGGMVAGVAHEINTPIGMGVSTASYLLEKVNRYSELYNEGSLTQDVFEEFLETSKESAGILLNNLTRAANLIRGFKQVAVDQSSDEMRVINLHEYLQEVLYSLKHEYSKTGHGVVLECPEYLQLNTYPGALSQIITNMIMNSLIHGFEDMEKGSIRITVNVIEDNIELLYQDNGKGLEQDVLKNIFEPFYTTKRGQGGSGLGMHIVFNIVNQALNGSIKCESRPGAGVKFTIVFPGRVEASENLNRLAV